MVNVGKWAFIAGVILAILAGFFAIANLAVVLLILGLIVGFLNVAKEEQQSYLIAVIALIVIGVGSLQALSVLGVSLADWTGTVFANFLTFIAASGLVVAIKTIADLGKPR
ncbi:MAG: hypothetical protein OEV37_02640 [Candidatus Berkelbacteria bacterium]|nr:hypothetical protein [Candidatus Berkelbacteria bacterium]